MTDNSVNAKLPVNGELPINGELAAHSTTEQQAADDHFALLLAVLEHEATASPPTPDPNVYDDDGYNCFGYNREGYDRNGYNWQGFDKQRRSRWLRRPSTARRMMRRAILGQRNGGYQAP